MFILDSLFISGFRWVLDTVVTAAEAERNDDTALREQLLAAEMRREMGEISDDEFADVEADLLARIREIKERREGSSGPMTFGAPLETTADTTLHIDATVSGDFHEPVGGDSGTAIEGTVLGAAPVGDTAPEEAPATRPAHAPRTRRGTPTARTAPRLRRSRPSGKIRRS